MSQYVSVRSNWTSIDCQTLELVCDVGFEETDDSIGLDENKDQNDQQHPISSKTSSDETVKSVTLHWQTTDERQDPQVIVKLVQPNENQINSIEILSSARNVEFYHREYLGTCQGSRIAEIETESIYETNFQFEKNHSEVTLKFLKLANPSELIIYCLQINLIKRKEKETSIHLPFDLERVRSMIDETNLSSNARQFMSDLKNIEERRRTTETSSSHFNIGQMMMMMQKMSTGSSATTAPKETLPTHFAPLLKQLKTSTVEKETNSRSTENPTIQSDFNGFEQRLNTAFKQLQEHIDARFDRLEKRLEQIEKHFQQTEN